MISLPPLFLYWLLIHPFVNFWRTKGIGMTYGVVLTIIGMGMIGLFSIRHHLLTNDYGANYTLIVLGVVCLVAAGSILPVVADHRGGRRSFNKGDKPHDGNSC